MYTLRFAKSAQKSLLRIPGGIATRMLAELKQIAAQPSAYRGDWKPLQGADLWRLRVGDWRAICEMREGELLILVVKIATLGDVYK